MPDIRVSFQGGGAYLAMMLPIAHAINSVEKAGLLKVEGVAGASAGSICAALLASKCDFDHLREEMKKDLAKDVEAMTGSYYKPLGMLGITRTIFNVFSGRDLVSREKLAIFIRQLLSLAEDCPVDISNFHTANSTANLFIARSKLNPSFLEITNSGTLIDAIVDSCSIPFALKNYVAAREQCYVDGGLCENLPIKCFDPEDNIPLFAVSVTDGSITSLENVSLLGYLLSLFSMTVGYSVERSKETVGESFCLDEKADFKFHEIEKAVEWYLDDDKYNAIKQSHEARLRGFSEYYHLANAGPVFMVGKNTLSKRNRDMKVLFRSLYPQSEWSISSSTMVVTAHSSNPQNAEVKTDIVQNIGIVEALCDAPKAYKGHIFLAGKEVHPTSWTVYNLSKKRTVEFRAVHYQDPDDGGTDVDPCYLVFDNPTEEISKGDILQVRAIMPTLPNADMVGLLNDGDYVVMNNRHQSSTRLSIVLRYPIRLGSVSSKAREGNLVDFEPMSQEEVGEFSPPIDVEFRAVGVKSLAPARTGERMAIDFSRDS